MQIAVQAQCWDGLRSKSLLMKETKITPVHVEPGLKEKLFDGARRLKDPKVMAVLSYAVPLMFLASGFPPFGLVSAFAHSVTPDAVPVMAAAPDIQEKIIHAFDPLINLIKSLSYPIAGVMIAGGCLFIMVGNREKGLSMLQNAAIGYFLVQLSPLLLRLLVGMGSGL